MMMDKFWTFTKQQLQLTIPESNRIKIDFKGDGGDVQLKLFRPCAEILKKWHRKERSFRKKCDARYFWRWAPNFKPLKKYLSFNLNKKFVHKDNLIRHISVSQ